MDLTLPQLSIEWMRNLIDIAAVNSANEFI